MPVTGFPQPVRDRIMEHLKDRFLAVQQGVDDALFTWNAVERRPLTDGEQQVGNAISLIDPGESKTEEIGFIRSDLQVVTEFWIRPFQGEDLAQQATLVLAEVHRVMRSDIYCTVVPGDVNTQLTLNITEQRNEVDVDGYADNIIGGAIFWSVLYRHHKTDARKLPGE